MSTAGARPSTYEMTETEPGLMTIRWNKSRCGEQVVADLVAQVLVDVAGCTQFTNGEGIGAITHTSTLVLEPAVNRASNFARFAPACRGTTYAGC